MLVSRCSMCIFCPQRETHVTTLIWENELRVKRTGYQRLQYCMLGGACLPETSVLVTRDSGLLFDLLPRLCLESLKFLEAAGEKLAGKNLEKLLIHFLDSTTTALQNLSENIYCLGELLAAAASIRIFNCSPKQTPNVTRYSDSEEPPVFKYIHVCACLNYDHFGATYSHNECSNNSDGYILAAMKSAS